VIFLLFVSNGKYFEQNNGFGVTLGRVAKGSDNKQPMSLSVSDKTCV
jgi:hypothetical protein